MISWAMAWYAVKSHNKIDEAFFAVTGFFDIFIVIAICMAIGSK